MAEKLQAMVEAGEAAGRIKDMEQAFGLNYCRDGAMFDKRCRDIMKVPESTYWDPQHCIFSSGGVAQYEINGLLRMLKANGIDIPVIDGWINKVSIPSTSMHSLPQNFLRYRFRDEDNAHLKGFASESLVLLRLLLNPPHSQ
jgi:hypothetical protein